MNRYLALLLFAARDLRRRPFDALLGGVGLTLLVGLFGAMTLASHALGRAATRALEMGPSLVVRRIHQGRWDGMPADAVSKVLAVKGVTGATVRTFGKPGTLGSDLAVFVFREEEAAPMIPDITKALPFPVYISTRTEAIGRATAFFARRSGWSVFLLLPAVVGLVLLTAGTIRERLSTRGEVGLLKALGWTTSDVAAFHLLRALLIGVPGMLLGMTAAVVAVVLPGITWPLTLIGEWEAGSSPALALSVEGGLTALAVVAGGVLVPWITASLLPALAKSTEDPADLILGG